jgi:HAD superfamily hydrolase (TIGR01450 family)
MKNLARVRHLALDMDGTIYRGGTLFPWTVPFLEQIRRMGIGYTFFTNNSSKGVGDYLKHLERMGISATAAEMYTSTLATIAYVKKEYMEAKRIYFVGTASMVSDFEAEGFTSCDENPDLVVVGFDPKLSFEQLCRGAHWIAQGKPFVATHPDRVCPTDLPTVLIDCGAICAALTSATGRAPAMVLGKPHPIMVEEIVRRNGLRPEELAVVGDRLYTDVAMAHAIGAIGVLVLTGETTREEAEAANPRPHFILPSIRELGDRLEADRLGVGNEGAR